MKVLVIKYKDFRIFGRFGGSRHLAILIPALFFDEKRREGLIRIDIKQPVGINKPVTTAMIKNYIDELKQIADNYIHHYQNFNVDYWNTIDKLLSSPVNPSDPDENIVLEIPGEDEYCYSDLLRDGLLGMHKMDYKMVHPGKKIPTLVKS